MKIENYHSWTSDGKGISTGYEIKKKIVERLEDYVDIKFGSIYYAI